MSKLMSNIVGKAAAGIRVRKIRKLSAEVPQLSEFVQSVDVDLWPDLVSDARLELRRKKAKLEELVGKQFIYLNRSS